MRRAALVAVLVLLAGACRWPGPHPGGGVQASVTVAAPGVAGARGVDVTVAQLADGTAATVELRVDRPAGAPVATATAVPAHFEIPDPGPGHHLVFASVRAGRLRAFGLALVANRLRLNQLQALGTHNSYHQAPTNEPWSLIEPWQFSHSPLDVQFQSEGVRQIELDVYVDPAGHRVVHVPDADFGTSCVRYVDCLRVVKGWSDAHPAHVPIAILTELNDDDYGLPTPIIKWDAPAMDQLDAEIRSVFSADDLVTPDDVRGRHATLAEAVATDGWPTLDAARGKVLFLMDNGGRYRDQYLAGHPALAGRVLFTNSLPGQPDAAFVKLNDPIGSQQQIHDAVAAGYVVRTRADSDTFEARANDTTRRDAALASGAQWVSSDFPVPGRAYGQPYFVSIPGGTPARCNPVSSPPWCTSALVESLP